MRMFWILLFCFIAGSGSVANAAPPHILWPKSIYADESRDYLKLNSDGFSLRFRLSGEECNQLAGASVVLKNAPDLAVARFSRVVDFRAWPQPYGLSELSLCWWQADVLGIDLNDIAHNYYAIRLVSRDNLYPLVFFQGITDSLLPARRLSQGQVLEWIPLGEMGATPVSPNGVFFKIWEPIADEVHVECDERSQKMNPSAAEGAKRFHALYIPEARVGSSYVYRFKKNGSFELSEIANFGTFSDEKIDPYALAIEYTSKGGYYNGYINARATVKGSQPYAWQNDQRILQSIRQAPNLWLMYQLWPLTFNPPTNDDLEYSQGNYPSILRKVPYLADLGINTVEFLPLSEGRFHASWGYALDTLFVNEPTYGTPDELKVLIDTLHARGIRVVLDVIINHINNQLLREPLSQTVTSSKYFLGNTGWGPKPDFRNVMVRKWIADALVYQMREFHADGFRFDMIEFVYRDNPAGYQFVQELNELLRLNNPRFYSTAEQLPDNTDASRPVAAGGLGFDAQWNDQFKNSFELQFDHYRSNARDVDLDPLVKALQGFSDQAGPDGVLKRFYDSKRTVNYLGSHDFIGNKDPILRIVSGYRSYERDGQNVFFRINPLEDPNPQTSFRTVHNDFTHSLARTAYGVLFTKPGAVLFFQGEELGNDRNIENEWSFVDAVTNNTLPSKDVPIDRYVRSHRMPWEYLRATAPVLSFLTPKERKFLTGHRQYFKDLLAFRTKHAGIGNQDPTNVRLSQGLLSYEIKDGPSEYFVVANFGQPLAGAWVQFPGTAENWWQEVINSSNQTYGAYDQSLQNPISHKGGRFNQIRLGGPGFAIFRRTFTSSIQSPLYVRGTFNDWQTSKSCLSRTSSMANTYSTHIRINFGGYHEFKVASADWVFAFGLATPSVDSVVHLGSWDDLSGQLTYAIDRPNASATLSAGCYRFLFNAENYVYRFVKDQEESCEY